MIREVLLRREAEQDLLDAVLWYEAQGRGLGHQILDEVLSVCSVIAESPTIYPSVHKNTRRTLIARLPIGIYYRVENEIIVIVAIMDGVREPLRWR